MVDRKHEQPTPPAWPTPYPGRVPPNGPRPRTPPWLSATVRVQRGQPGDATTVTPRTGRRRSIPSIAMRDQPELREILEQGERVEVFCAVRGAASDFCVARHSSGALRATDPAGRADRVQARRASTVPQTRCGRSAG